MITGTSVTRIVTLALLFAVLPAPALAAEPQPIRHRILEGFPDRIEAARENYRKQLQAAGAAGAGAVPFHLIVPKVQRWQPGSVIRVAFNGGTPELHERIRSTALAWTQPSGANLHLKFQDAQGRFLQWTDSDIEYAAEIRVGFLKGKDYGGYWSAVGTDSITADAGASPKTPSLNLEGFDEGLPYDWQATVLHEFGHALGFEHEHQSPAGGCDFRYQDDLGYVLTKDANGWYTQDPEGRKPSVYTYLGGHANYWPAPKVDYNLRQLPTSSAFLMSEFDRDSIMKYFFPEIMFIRGEHSFCFKKTDNAVLSPRDLEGARRAYPRDPPSIAAAKSDIAKALEQIRTSPAVAPLIREQASMRLKAEFDK